MNSLLETGLPRDGNALSRATVCSRASCPHKTRMVVHRVRFGLIPTRPSHLHSAGHSSLLWDLTYEPARRHLRSICRFFLVVSFPFVRFLKPFFSWRLIASIYHGSPGPQCADRQQRRCLSGYRHHHADVFMALCCPAFLCSC